MHELQVYAEQASVEIGLEYQRIFNRSREDPGTAGDEGEENWAKLLRLWFPAHYHVVTKGRILAANGKASKQFDVLVLRPTYPVGLLDKKLYMAPGVVAVFECKLTLQRKHIDQIFQRNVELKRMYGRAGDDPGPPVVGLLAHAHAWKSSRMANQDRLGELIYTSYLEHVQDLPEALDILCIANLGAWCHRTLFEVRDEDNQEGSPHPTALYIGPHKPTPDSVALNTNISPIGAFLNHLMFLLAKKEPELRPYQAYFEQALNLGIATMTIMKEWSSYVRKSPRESS
jgi:hypothetical protein